ncbi:hypothetical protein [Hominifimenecus sp. rT4P-3]|uniref:hypothetical protein n=1 Tax=Hominifimenecus sp. rT4P-3 TaxID=3242979 RepID=UPI003DA63A5D
MRKRKLVFYDEDREYAARFADYGNHREGASFEVIPFTEHGELIRFLMEEPVDLALIPPKILDEELQARVKSILLLTEQKEGSAGNHTAIYKYQSCGQIMREVERLEGRRETAPAGEALRATGIGVYSPVHRCYKTTFSLILGQLLAEKGAAAYLNLEEYSGFPALLGKTYEEDLSDFLYFRRVGQEEGGVLGRMEYLGKLAYLPPVSCPADIRGASAEEVTQLIREVGAGTYDYLVIDFGESLIDPVPALELCTTIYMPVCEDRASGAKADAFENYLKQIGKGELIRRIRRIVLPYYSWLAGGCGDYRGLRWSAFGKYVKTILSREEMEWKSSESCRKL